MQLCILGLIALILLYVIFYIFENYDFLTAYIVTTVITEVVVILKNFRYIDDVSYLIIDVLVAAAVVLGVSVFQYIIYKISDTFMSYILLICLFLLLAYAIALKVTGIPYNILIFQIIQKIA